LRDLPFRPVFVDAKRQPDFPDSSKLEIVQENPTPIRHTQPGQSPIDCLFPNISRLRIASRSLSSTTPTRLVVAPSFGHYFQSCPEEPVGQDCRGRKLGAFPRKEDEYDVRHVLGEDWLDHLPQRDRIDQRQVPLDQAMKSHF
jgi:hypothetical protein